MSRPGLGAPKPPPPPADRYPSDYIHQALKPEPHPFETGQPKEETSWAPNIKVLAGAGVGTPLAGVLIWVLGEFGVEMPWDVALYFAGLIILAVAYFVPEKKS